MKTLLVYWVMGCILYGMALGNRLIKCPNNTIITSTGALIEVALWPSAIVGGIRLAINNRILKMECET